MKVTKGLREWLVKNAGLTAETSEEDCKVAITKSLTEGKLSPKEFASLSDCCEEDPIEAKLAGIVEKAIDAKLAKMTPPAAKGDEPPANKAGDDDIAKTFGSIGRPAMSEPTPAKMFGGAGEPRVKGAHEQYSTSRAEAFYPRNHKHFAGLRAAVAGQMLDHPSDLDKAISGAYFKLCANATAAGRPLPRCLRMTDHDRQLMDYAVRETAWTGLLRGDGIESAGAMKIDGRKLSQFETKALLDDITSGGIEAAPVVFDNAVILYPVLYGELFPLVDVQNIARGRRIEGFSIGNPTFTSGTAEGTEITPLTTDGMIAAFDTSIYNAVGAIEIGQDFESDAAVDIGKIVIQKFGEKAQEWLDRVVAYGNGTSEPQGVFLASGLTDIVNPTGGAGAAPVVDDYERLLFGLAKQYRPSGDKQKVVFLANDTTYRRARAIHTPTYDVSRVFGMDHESYQLLGHPFKVINTLGNNLCGCFNMKYYRMYRRLGMTVRTETGGRELALKNLTLIVVRMRWGGKMELGGAGAFSDNWQA